mgnify:CR=1 FL=1
MKMTDKQPSAKRLEEIAKPLDDLLKKLNFEMYGDPLVEDNTRMVGFKHSKGMELDYDLTVRRDNPKGYGGLISDVHLSVRLSLPDKKTVELYPFED